MIFENGLVGCWKLIKAIFRLLGSPFVGAWKACEEDYRRPRPENWRADIRFAFKSYFAPLTGAVAGVKRELKRSFK